MKIKGIGVDLVEITRIKEILDEDSKAFLKRIFLPEEIEYCYKFKDSYRHFAGIFAAKEAISKSLGIGISEHLKFTDISIVRTPNGQPITKISKESQSHLGNPKILLSIAHSHAYAVATAITTG